MTEDHSYQLPPGDNNLSGSTASNGVASGRCDFNKYDPYVERIRTLFVPSLEPRIHSCLETFVYRRESGQRSDPPYLRRCLDAAATLRGPVEAFCTKWRDSGFVETMLATVVKFLITNGPIDCFLNSIILNNRLNKVCRDLDALGVERDLLRYLAVWNYINERDYWLEEDNVTSTSKFDESRDFSVDRRSDLDVEIGSGLDSLRNDRSVRRVFKRRATDSSDDRDRSGASQDVRDSQRARVPFPSRLSVDSSNPEGSRPSSARRKIRSCQVCRPATCPSYRAKDPAPVNWEGKTLKLQLCKTSLATPSHRPECRKSSKKSALNLPCKCDDLIGEIVEAHPTSSRRFFAQRRQKFKAGVTSICSRVNETLGKIDGKEVARCRLHCEILPGCVSFRLVERARDGSEVCLFGDRVPLDRIDSRQRDPGRSSGSERRLGEQKIAHEAELTIYKNSGFSPADDESRVVGNLEEKTSIKTEPEDILIRPSDADPEAAARKNVEQSIERGRSEASNRSSEDKPGEPTCGCDTPFDDEAARRRKEDDEDEASEPKSPPRESNGERSTDRSSGNAISGARPENLLDDNRDRSATNEENDEAVDGNNVQEVVREESSIHPNENLTGDQKCTCGVSSDCLVDHRDRAIEADRIQAVDRQASGIADSHGEFADSALEGAAEKDRRAKLRRASGGSLSAKKHQPDVPTDNRLEEVACACRSDCSCPNRGLEQNKAEECDDKCSCDSCSRDDEPGALKKTEIIRMSALLEPRTETPDSGARELPVPTSSQRTGALVSASDESQFCCVKENEPEECDSECLCDTRSLEGEPRSLKKSEIIRMSSFLKRKPEGLVSGAQELPVPNSSQRNGALVSASEEFQCRSSSFHSQDLEIRRGSSMKSDTPLETKATKTRSFVEADSQRAQPDRRSAVQRTSSVTNECPRNIPSMKSDEPLETKATKTRSFVEADSQRAQPDRRSAVQRTSSVTNECPRNISSEEHRLSLKKYQSDVPADNQRDKIACECPSDCNCPNSKSAEENQPEECDSQCSGDTCREDKPGPLKKTDITPRSSLLRSRTGTLDSFQDSPDPSSTLKNGAFLVSATEFQRGSTEDQTSIFNSQDLEFPRPSMRSSPLGTTAAETMSFTEAESPPARPDRRSAVQRTSSATNKSRRNISSEENPVVASRFSRPKGQRINICIEVCPESESSTERIGRHEHETAKDEFEIRKDATAFRKPRRHFFDEPQTFGKRVLDPGEDTRDEFLTEPRFAFAGVRSPPRPLESRDYLPHFRSPSSIDGQSASRGRRRRGDSCVTKNRHGSIQRNGRANEEEEMPKNSSRLPSESGAFSSSGLRTNVGRALSASSVDRMKHLIRTKLRRMLLERDKATNTPKTTLTNRKYRVSAPGAKNDRSLFGQEPCRTIWESRSASDSLRTSRSFASDDRERPAAIRGREEARKLLRSTGNARVESSSSRDRGGACRFDGGNSSRKSESGRRRAANERAPEVASGTNFPRLAGGSDFDSKMRCQEKMRRSENCENRCVLQNENGRFDENFMNRSLQRLPEETGDSSAGKSCEASGKKIPDESAEFHGIPRIAGKERAPEVDSVTDFPRPAGGSDFGSKSLATPRHENAVTKMHSSGRGEHLCASQNNARINEFDVKFENHSFKEVPKEIDYSSSGKSRGTSGEKILDESSEFYGKLDWSGNSTSRHIDLVEFDRSGSSSDETESVGRRRSPPNQRLPEVRGTPRRNVDAHHKKLTISRASELRSSRGPSAPRDKSAVSGRSGNTNKASVSAVRRIGAFGNIDQDLRKKLSQYVSLCKNVKYSLLKRLRPDDIYEVSRTSIPRCDRYKFGDT